MKRIDSNKTATYLTDYTLKPDQYTSEVTINNKPTLILDKLRFIDNVLARYKANKVEPISLPTVANSPDKEIEQRRKVTLELDGLLDASSILCLQRMVLFLDQYLGRPIKSTET